MSARMESVQLRPGDTLIVHVPHPGDDGAKVRLLAETLGSEGSVEVVSALEGFELRLIDRERVEAYGWVARE